MHANLGVFYSALGRFEAAGTEFNVAIEFSPYEDSPLRGLFWLQLHGYKNNASANSFLTELQSLAPDDPRTHLRRSAYFARVNDWPRACDAIKECAREEWEVFYQTTYHPHILRFALQVRKLGHLPELSQIFTSSPCAYWHPWGEATNAMDSESTETSLSPEAASILKELRAMLDEEEE